MRETSNLQNSKTPKRRNPKTQHDLISRSRLTVILSTQTSKHRYQYRYRYFLVPATPRTHFLPYPPLPLLTSHFSLPNLYRNECTQTLKPLSHSRSLGTTNNFKPFSNRETSTSTSALSSYCNLPVASLPCVYHFLPSFFTYAS